MKTESEQIKKWAQHDSLIIKILIGDSLPEYLRPLLIPKNPITRSGDLSVPGFIAEPTRELGRKELVIPDQPEKQKRGWDKQRKAQLQQLEEATEKNNEGKDYVR